MSQTMTKARAKPSADRSRGRIVVVEDEPDIAEVVRYNLEREGYTVICSDQGERALKLIASRLPDLVVLDLMLPGIDGLEVCRRLKADTATAKVPVVMLTARGEEAEIVVGLEMGADDYITKPFSPRVLAARIKAILRRRDTTANESAGDRPLEIDDLRIDPQRHQVHFHQQLINTTATEFRLLMLLARRPGRVYTRQQIIDILHGERAAVTDRSVDVMVLALRRKLGPGAALVQTVRGVGYRFRSDD